MPERLKPRQEETKPRLWDRFRKETKTSQVTAAKRRESPKKEPSAKKIHYPREKAKSPTKPALRQQAPVPPEKTAKRPIERVLYGVGRAVSWWPRKQEKWLYHSVYEKYIYPRLTPKQKKKAKEWEPKIKKAAKAGGWIMTGAEVIIAGVIAKKLYRKVRQRFVPLSSITEGGALDKKTQKAARHAEDALPGWFRDVLSTLQDEFDRGLPQKLSDKPLVIQHLLHDIGQLAAQGMPSEVSDKIARIGGIPDQKARNNLAIEALFAWNEWLEKSGRQPLQMPHLAGIIIGFEKIGYDKLALLDPTKLSHLRSDSVLAALDAMFPLVSGSRVPETVRNAIRTAQQFFRTLESKEGQMHSGEPPAENAFVPLIKEFYMYLVEGKTSIETIDRLPNRDAQIARLDGEFERFLEAFLSEQVRRKRDMTTEQLEKARSNMNMKGGMLGLFGYHGIGEIGIQLKNHPSGWSE